MPYSPVNATIELVGQYPRRSTTSASSAAIMALAV
jgi:hypothetical protein